MIDVEVEAPRGASVGYARFGEREFRCALGTAGIVLDKIEGDGGTPAGRFPLRRLFYRPDRVRAVACAVAMRPLSPADGWCDDTRDPGYNRLVALPYPARHEILWREDHLYDLVLVIGHNDDPVVAGKGSAVFLHLAHPDYRPTEGCIAFSRADFMVLLEAIRPDTMVAIRQKGM